MDTDPGFVNAHTHLYAGLASFGMPVPEPRPEEFLDILAQVWWRLDRALDAASLRAAARYYVAEALFAGTTGIIDHHESPEFIEGSLDVLADVCQELGMPAVLCYGVTERNGGRAEAIAGLDECRRFIQSNDRRFVRGVIGIHASFTVSNKTLLDVRKLALELDTVVHVHVAEDKCDVIDARKRGFPGPIARMLELGCLPPGSILAHGVHAGREEVKAAVAQGLWFVQNPRSNRANGVGFPWALAECERVALGTDGYRSFPREEIEAFREHMAMYDADPDLDESRLENSRKILSERFGRELPSSVDESTVTIDERTVLEGDELVCADFAEIRAEAEREAQRVWERMRAAAPTLGQPPSTL